MAKIELSREAYFHNLDIIAQKVGDISKIAVVLKDNAYGHGLLEMAALSKTYGVRQAVVHNTTEAAMIKSYFTEILILGGHHYVCDPHYCYVINTREQIVSMPKGLKVELKVDTGMHRNGVAMDEVSQVLSELTEAGLELRGVMTHHRSADTLSSEYFWQRENFSKVKEEVRGVQKRLGLGALRFHASNSAATFRSQQCKDDLVRVGIAAYGCLEMARTLPQPELRPVLTLKAEKIATRTIAKGAHVGYNATFSATEEMVVSTYDVGYADGLLRSASNHYMTPEGAELLGRISMDNSSFSGARRELVIFDDVNTFAKAAGTIGYEVLTGLHPEIERVIV